MIKIGDLIRVRYHLYQTDLKGKIGIVTYLPTASDYYVAYVSAARNKYVAFEKSELEVL